MQKSWLKRWWFAVAVAAAVGCGIGCSAASSAKDAMGPIPLSYFGLHLHRADRGTAWPNVPFGSWRLWDAGVTWAYLEPKKAYWDFSRLDRYVAMASIANVDIVLPLGASPQWASARPYEPSAYQPGWAAEPAQIEDWIRYVQVIGNRYRGRIRHYEIWNEPSDKAHFSGDIDAIVRLTCEAKRVLHQIDPTIAVVSAASAGGGKHIEYLDRYLAAGANKCVDIVAHHFYVFRQGPEAMVPFIRQVRQVMEKNGVGDKPLWNTETGWWLANGDGTPDHPMVAKGGWKKLEWSQESGDVLERALMLARAEGVERFYWYGWDNQYGLGMIEPTSGKPKPIVDRWRSVVQELQGATGLRCSQRGREWTCSYTRRDGRLQQRTWLMP